MKKEVDVTYVVASKLGTIGMGSTAYNAVRGIEDSSLEYKVFCRGYAGDLKINKKNFTGYSFLEYLSYPFRFVEKFFKIKVNSFKLVNGIFGKFILWNLPKTKIYHTWMDVAPEAIEKAKKEGAILVLEGANSHPLNCAEILNKEYQKLKMKEYFIDIDEIKKKSSQLAKFDYVLCPSQFVYDSFLKNGFKKEQLFLVPYGTDPEKFSSEKKEKHKNFRAIFIGSIQIRKGIQYLLESWENLNLKNAELLIVGRVWPDAAKIVSKYKNNPSIKFLGFDSNPQKYLKEADVFVSPSLEEGSALTCYEAMAAGLPVIATYNTGSIARDKLDGFVIKTAESKVMAEKIKYFYDNRKEIIKMGKNARKNVENYSWDNYGKKVLEVYKKILAQNIKSR